MVTRKVDYHHLVIVIYIGQNEVIIEEDERAREMEFNSLQTLVPATTMVTIAGDYNGPQIESESTLDKLPSQQPVVKHSRINKESIMNTIDSKKSSKSFDLNGISKLVAARFHSIYHELRDQRRRVKKGVRAHSYSDT